MPRFTSGTLQLYCILNWANTRVNAMYMSLTAYQMANIYMIPAQGTKNLLDTIRTASQNAAAERACDVRPSTF